MDRLVHDGTRRNAVRPVRQGNDAGAAFVEHPLALAVRPVIGGDGAFGGVHLTGELGGLRAAVVALEHDERVLAHLAPLQGVEHSADLVIHSGDHRRVSAAVGIDDVLVPVEVFLRRLIGRVGRGEGR